MRHRKEKQVLEQDIHQFLLEESEKSRLVREIMSELESPRYHEYFSRFDEESVKQFIHNYAVKKAQYLQHGPNYIREQEETLSDDLADATEMIWEIQQKVFNLQCLWRAERIHVPGIDICYDFAYWEKNISKCPHLENVTLEEIELYIAYINSDFYADPNPLASWQDFDGFRKENHEEGYAPFPAWYSFYDSHMGTEDLFTLENIRGEKEKQYLSSSEQNPTSMGWMIPYHDKSLEKPHLDLYAPGVLQGFIKEFENRKMLDFCVAYETELRKKNEYKTVEAALNILKNAGERIPIDASADWQTAIIQAAWKYERQEAERNIRLAFQEYQLREQTGISQLPTKWAIQEELYAERLENQRKAIIQGRVQAGEEGNFNF